MMFFYSLKIIFKTIQNIKKLIFFKKYLNFFKNMICTNLKS
jgi:hypothetical protein